MGARNDFKRGSVYVLDDLEGTDCTKLCHETVSIGTRPVSWYRVKESLASIS